MRQFDAEDNIAVMSGKVHNKLYRLKTQELRNKLLSLTG
jgi:hypothetical protein